MELDFKLYFLSRLSEEWNKEERNYSDDLDDRVYGVEVNDRVVQAGRGADFDRHIIVVAV